MGSVRMGFCCCDEETPPPVCACDCPECAPTGDPPTYTENAACCWHFEYEGHDVFLSRENDYLAACVWRGGYCDEGVWKPAELRILSGVVTLEIDGKTFTLDTSPGKPDCCAPMTLTGPDGEATITAHPGATCFCNQPCLELTVAGIAADPCDHCEACPQLNGTYPASGGMGTCVWTGTACRPGRERMVCGGWLAGHYIGAMNTVSLVASTSGSTTTVTGRMSSYYWDGTQWSEGPWIRWEATIGANEALEGLTLTYHSSSAGLECDVAASTMTITYPAEPCVCDQTPCRAPPEQSDYCYCHDGEHPRYWEVTIPDGMVGDWGANIPGTYLIPIGCEFSGPVGRIDGDGTGAAKDELGYVSAGADHRYLYVTFTSQSWRVYGGPTWVDYSYRVTFRISTDNWECPGWNWAEFDCFLLGQLQEIYVYEEGLSYASARAMYLGDQTRGNYPWQQTVEICEAAGCPPPIFLGSREHLGDVLAAADCGILVSRSEGHSLAVNEAALFGLPMVGTRVGVIPELERQYGPLIVPVALEADGDELASAVALAVSDENKPVAQRAQMLARREFTLSAMSARWQRLLLNL